MIVTISKKKLFIQSFLFLIDIFNEVISTLEMVK